MRLYSLYACVLVACGDAGSGSGSDLPVDHGQDPEILADNGSSVVGRSVFARATKAVTGIDYLPFRYKLDGCYARALYMSMELAAIQIESNSIFAFAQGDHPLEVGEISWGYHVAPMLGVAENPIDELSPVAWTVLDPALAIDPLSTTEWIESMGRSSTAEDRPEILIVPGSRYSPDQAEAETTWRNKDIPSFAELPPFRTSDIQAACSVMHEYLELEPIESDASNGAGPEEKSNRLLKRTPELLERLALEGKLLVDEPFSLEDCASF